MHNKPLHSWKFIIMMVSTYIGPVLQNAECSKIIFSCYSRRDSNILLPKTPSMKRKRQESDEEQSSDDIASLTEKGAKAHKTQVYSSPLKVINENKLLDCSVTNEEGKLDGAKRTTRAIRASSQPKRQQPKRGLRKKNLPDVGGSAKDQTSDSSSMDDKPRRTTRNSKQKNSELARVKEESGSESSVIFDEEDSSKRVTRNTRKKPRQETVKSNVATILKDCGEIMVPVAVEQEPASPFDKIPKSRSTRNSRNEEDSVDSEKKENENRAHVPETPEAVVENVMLSPKSATTCKATIDYVLQSPGLSKATSETPSSPHIELDLGPHQITAEENGALPEEEINNDVITACSSTPILLQECTESHAETKSKNKKELENGEVKNVAGNEPDSDAIDGDADVSNEAVDEENTKVADPRVKSGRKSMHRNSGWRRKSKRSSRCLISPVNKRLSTCINRTVTKSKTSGKKSLIKSSVKLKLTQSKLMPELKINTADKCRDGRSPDHNLADVRVCLFDNLTSESSSSGTSSGTTSSSCSSAEDKVEAPSSSSCSSAEDKAETPVEEPVDEDSEEVFHDCRGSENEADDETSRYMYEIYM